MGSLLSSVPNCVTCQTTSKSHQAASESAGSSAEFKQLCGWRVGVDTTTPATYIFRPIFHQLLCVWTIRWGAVHLLDSSTQWLLFDRLTHIIDLMYYSSPIERNNHRRAQKMQSARLQTDTGGHCHSEGALVLLCRWSQRAGISQQPSRPLS